MTTCPECGEPDHGPDLDLSKGWARRITAKRHGKNLPETWGVMQHGETGQMIECYRGPRNRCRWYDMETGEQVGPELKNVAPAIAWAFVHGYFDPELAAVGIFTRVQPTADGKSLEVVTL